MEKRSDQKAKTRKKLIDSALELSSKKGFAALSLREVTQAAEIAPTAFYRHFKDMDELGLSLVDEIAVSLRRLLRNARHESKSEDASNLTVFSIETFLIYVNENANLFRLLLGERQGSSDIFRRAIRKEIEIFVEELTEDLERLAKARKEKLRNSAYAAEAIVTIIFSLGAEALDLPKFKQESLKVRMIEEVNMILRGAKAR
jgi:TetR/AcrR family transcriptional regulator, fatty acid biosynthesis regulator